MKVEFQKMNIKIFVMRWQICSIRGGWRGDYRMFLSLSVKRGKKTVPYVTGF